MDNKFEGRIAGESYEKVLSAISPFYHPLLAEMAAKASELISTPKPVIVDLGCGTGLSTEHLLANCPSSSVLAVDISDEMLRAVCPELKRSSQVRWYCSDMNAFLSGLPDHSLDIAANGYAVHNLPPEARASLFQLLSKKLRPGGLFVSADKIAVDDEDEHHKMLSFRKDEYRALSNLGFSKEAQEWVDHYDFDERIRLSARELRDGLREAGFAELHFGTRSGMYAVAWAVRG